MRSFAAILLSSVFGLGVTLHAQAPKYPFPQAIHYSGCIKPSNATQDQMNQAVTALYKNSYKKYLTASKKTAGGYYINAKGTGSGNSAITVSEAHGYGMVIMPIMAGFDDSAHVYFDGLFKFFNDHRSNIDSKLMAWEVLDGEVSDNNSATDGDLDIAYGLVLAYHQWGTSVGGTIDYLAEAKKVLTGIKSSDMSTKTYRTVLGDWCSSDLDTRSSDWMPDHFRAFVKITSDTFWTKASTTVYSMISSITAKYSPQTGLLPDFVTADPPAPDPDGGGTGESNADKYFYNSCRDPWRIACDYALYTTPEAKTMLTKLTGWARTATNNDPAKLKNGYALDGTAFGTGNDICFIAPMTAGAIADSANQTFLNNGWTAITKTPGSDVYACALNLLSMLVITGNYWLPGSNPTPVVSVPAKSARLQNEAAVRVWCDRGGIRVWFDKQIKSAVWADLFSIAGRHMARYSFPRGSLSVLIPFNNGVFSSGTYLLRMSSMEGMRTAKVVVVR